MGRLASVLAGVGLLTTRLGLVAHELIGHGGTAMAFGGRITELRLFWFAGGWIRYDLPDHALSTRLPIALGGILLELVVGTILWIVLARRTRLGAQIARAAGAAIVIHGAWYLAIGTYHGFGDGVLLRYALGDWRYVVAIGAGLVAVTFAYLGARAILGVLAATLSGSRGARIAGVVVAVVLAGGVQGALIVAELHVRGDTTYGTLMQPERERVVERELAQWEQQMKQRGVDVDEAVRKQRERALHEQHRELPFAYILGAITVLAVLAGALRSRPGNIDVIPPRLVVMVAALAVGSVALVIAIDAAFA